MGRIGAVVVAAGRSTRMGGIDKVFVPIRGKPLVWYALHALHSCVEVEQIVLVTAAERVGEAEAMVQAAGFTRVTDVVAGGERRQDSVRAGLERLRGVDAVVVHDAARPLAGPEMMAAAIAAVRVTPAATAAVPVVDTLKEVDGEGNIVRTVPREMLWAVQTPQVFSYDILLAAHRQISADVTDDAALVELMGVKVAVFPGSTHNIKVTRAEDVAVASALLAHEA
jgi:2-C-methyl-D-erythritol 4-phosphate cytidylyltransferase